eukprot:GHRQ01029430.1.p1 GENE.GHRQ01029430.1~~GHRQ01029430.1.p1  ORF type:complete len:489 (+),score=148.86 GHRQ01029430.1:167-1633(+)
MLNCRANSHRLVQPASSSPSCRSSSLRSRHQQALRPLRSKAVNDQNVDMAENGRGGARTSRLDGKAPDGSDFANYFCTYAYLYHQKDMLEDHKRTGAYYNAVIQNRRQFKDKVVLDVGTGSGILAIFSAMAGAKKVYAVEATDMAKHARTLVAHNKFDGVIEVVQGTIETIELPEKVDIIISEWMGYFLLRESMLDSVLLARDRFLKPGGALYPSHARMYLAPMRTNASAGRINDFQNSMYGWSEFLKEMKGFYQVDLDCLSEAYRSEQKEYYMSTSAWGNVHPSQLMGPGACFKKYDLHSVTIDELKADLLAEVSLPIVDACGPVDAFCGWFDVEFKVRPAPACLLGRCPWYCTPTCSCQSRTAHPLLCPTLLPYSRVCFNPLSLLTGHLMVLLGLLCLQGSGQNPADDPMKLSTAPDATGPTHWGQQVFMLHPSIDVASGDSLTTKVKVARQKVNHRLLELDIEVKVTGNSIHATGEPRQLNWHID